MLAVKKLTNHFFVLTNGEHICVRGVNRIIEKSSPNVQEIAEKGYYFPGLAAGGVQWQNCYGEVKHPSVTLIH